ncbi:hepatic lectin-like [Eleutherodactylus coqui]|uniref:hepatic lectin-like n=1 Tax=Eleutherodactylus coqui TaxID=57060 RepID=UPI00346351F5
MTKPNDSEVPEEQSSENIDDDLESNSTKNYCYSGGFIKCSVIYYREGFGICDQGRGAERRMNVNTVSTGHLENDDRFIGLEVFKAMENYGPAEKGKFESCFGKSRSIVFTIVLCALILLICIILIIVVCVLISEFKQHAMEEQDYLNTKVANLSNLMGKICTACPAGWHAIDSSCYYLSVEQKTWYGARDECYKVDSFLAMITDRKKSDSLNTLFTGSIRYWIGLHRDPKNIHIWKWLDGTEVTFTNWGVNEPNFLKQLEHCGETRSGPWNDEFCNNSYNYICEKKRFC